MNELNISNGWKVYQVYYQRSLKRIVIYQKGNESFYAVTAANLSSYIVDYFNDFKSALKHAENLSKSCLMDNKIVGQGEVISKFHANRPKDWNRIYPYYFIEECIETIIKKEKTISELAHETGVCYESIRRWLMNAGYTYKLFGKDYRHGAWVKEMEQELHA